ncbi:endolytic transglycosylase MltG [Paenibacillus ginsengarvi]|uniref:Endolytic murein transglycosylase n=1 Tax=Paenibacillus ginsengarvi TaxID=400777 RepID=A0A3B0C3H4_9BACL|nr:endolytic transglycosylase MltG [Paenibacillus ginsengarvi]
MAFVVLWCVLLGLVLAGAGTAVYVASALKPVEASGDNEVRISIPAGFGSGQIARLLESSGLIRDAKVFRYYLIYKKEGARFQAGDYMMTKGMELDDIIRKLNDGDTVKDETLRFTIPEGYSVMQVADKLEEQPGFDRNAFLQLVNSKDEFAAVKWVSDIPDDPRIKTRLEGYLFPETYEMKLDSTTKDMVLRMAGELDKKLAGLPADWQDKLKMRGLTFHQMMTIASMIEREVVDDEERPLVASVIYNRMKIGMKLQLDATVQYVLDKPKERLFEKDLLIDSPYNTYKVAGLPPGPIASPSLKSIEAVLYPAESKFLFYVTKSDGSQKHNFAETYEQHLKNIADSKKR